MSVATETTIEQRLAATEAAIDEIRQHLPPSPATTSASDWLRPIRGIMADKAAFREMIAYGRAYRQADHPTDVEPL